MRVGLDARARIERDAGSLEPDALDDRRAADRHEHEVALRRLALTEVDGQRAAGVLDLRALLAEVDDDPAPRERLAQLARRVRVLLRNERVEHLDHRHLGAEALEDRRELAADDSASEHDEPLGHLGLRQKPGRVDAPWRVEPRNGRHDRSRARRDDRALEAESDLALVECERARVLEATVSLEPRDVVRLEERGDTARHLLDDGVLPFVRRWRSRAPARRSRRRAWD